MIETECREKDKDICFTALFLCLEFIVILTDTGYNDNIYERILKESGR